MIFVSGGNHILIAVFDATSKVFHSDRNKICSHLSAPIKTKPLNTQDALGQICAEPQVSLHCGRSVFCFSEQ